MAPTVYSKVKGSGRNLDGHSELCRARTGPSHNLLHKLGLEQKPVEQSTDKEQQRIQYHLKQALPAGSEADFKIHWSGKLTENVQGYHNSAYLSNGEKKFNAVTEFAATAARNVFPCWDEPALKATYAITMISRADTINLSNMPSFSETLLSDFNVSDNQDLALLINRLGSDLANWKITKFEDTPLASTYIVAWSNGHYAHLETSVELPVSGRTIPLRIFATQENIHMAQYALDAKKAALPLYEKVFDVAFPLPKLDTLVSDHFNPGAMENWGLIMGHTSVLLVDAEKGDLASKQKVQIQVLIPNQVWEYNDDEWWDYLYLNEGFATLAGEVVIIADKRLPRVFPEWKADSSFIIKHLSKALSLDAKLSSHPVEVDCPDANKVMQVGSFQSRDKGGAQVKIDLRCLVVFQSASVLRMLLNYVGEEVFLKGVSLYLKDHLYANATTKDLWKGIATATGKDVGGLMTSWIEKAGFPVLTVTEVPGGIKVRQDRFLETGKAENQDNETIWNVPLNLVSTTEDGKATVDRNALLTEREQIFKVDTSKPYKLNADTTGTYRVLYTPEHLSKLAKEAAKPKDQSILSLNDRVGLAFDVIALAQAGLAPVSSALTFMEGLKAETEYIVWSGVAESLTSLVSIWGEDSEVVAKLNGFRRELFAPVVERLGYEYHADEHPDITALRTTAITQAADAEDPAVVKELRNRFAHFLEMKDESKIPADLRKIVYAVAIIHGGNTEYEAIHEIQQNPRSPNIRSAATLAKSSTRDPALLAKNFEHILNGASENDVAYYFLGHWNNIKAAKPLAKFYMDNYDALSKRLESGFVWNFMMEKALSNLSTYEDCAKAEEFFKTKDMSKYNMTLAQAFDNARARAACKERSTDDLVAWFESKASSNVA